MNVPEIDLVLARLGRWFADEQPAYQVTHLPTGLAAIGPAGVNPDESERIARVMLEAGLRELGEI